ncbi:MAG: 4Fe-4S binding protein [Alphaproteobacteria bacterium]|jgi:2-oxoglutarate ferredoxin oxidoreductase subunit delta|nr:4Fe-4S binding protein [Alphaproteobacteria bacterium]
MAKARGTITIDEERCKGCELCIHYCPPEVLRLSERRKSLNHLVIELFDEANCTGCDICARVCPDIAITQVFREILAA